MADVNGDFVAGGPVNGYYDAPISGFGGERHLLRDGSSPIVSFDAEFVCINDAALDLVELP